MRNEISPEDFEYQIRQFFAGESTDVKSFEVTHCEKVDGQYEIDVLARIEFSGAEFVVLVACKKRAEAIDRNFIRAFHDRIGPEGTHKGMVFSTSVFQSDAINYAHQHGIALVHVDDGFYYMSGSADPKQQSEKLDMRGERLPYLFTWIKSVENGEVTGSMPLNKNALKWLLANNE